MGEVIVITSGKGGVGKTTTTANIGAGLSQLDKKVVIIDTDLGGVSGCGDGIGESYRLQSGGRDRREMQTKTGVNSRQTVRESVFAPICSDERQNGCFTRTNAKADRGIKRGLRLCAA